MIEWFAWGVCAGILIALSLGLALGSRRRKRTSALGNADVVMAPGSSLQEAIEAMDDGFTLWDAEDRLELWNGRFGAMYPILSGTLRRGVTLEECTRAVVQGLYGELDATERLRLVEQRLEAHRRVISPRHILRPDGTQLLVLERRTAIGGRVVIYRDVTDERRSVEALARSEAQFRDGIESMADGLILWGPDRRIRTWNERLLAIMPHLAPIVRTGVGLDDFLTRACEATFPDWDAERRGAWLRDRQAMAWVADQRTRLALPDDRHVAVSQRRTSDGGLVVTYHDVTAETRANRSLAESEARSRRLALAASNVQSGIVILDASSRVTWANPAMAEMVGTTLEALIGRTPRTAFISDETPREVLERIADALNHGRRIRAEMVLRHSDGRTVWVELDAAPMFGDDGRLESIVGLHTDIGQRKRQEGELKRSLAEARELNDQQRQFISIASHEFRTPLAVIDGAAQRIAASLDTAEVNDSITQRLHRIRSAIGRMNGMIELMLSSARLDAGQLDVKTGWIDLGALLHDACERQRQISPLFAIDTDGIASGIRVEADARLLDQVIANLLSNAVKYSGASRRIEVALRCVAGGVETTVRDFGLGIAAQDLPRMFTRFYRAGTSTGIPGTGIGLHFTREIVLLHGGSIDLASDLGRGTTFFVRLPVTQPRIDGASAAAS